MKLRRFLFRYLLILGSVLLYTCDTENNIDPEFKNYFIKYYGEDGDHQAKDFIINNDGTIIILGTVTFGQTVQTKRVYIVKTDLEGNELWNKTLGSDFNEIAQDIEPIIAGPDAGNFIVLSNLTVSQDITNFRLTVINAEGDSLKSFLFSEYVVQNPDNSTFISNSFSCKTVTSIADGSLYVSGLVYVNTPDNQLNASLTQPPAVLEDLLVVKLYNDYTIQYFDQIGRSYSGSAVQVSQVGTSFIYAGHSDDGELIPPALTQYQTDFFFRSFINNPSAVGGLIAGSANLNETMNAFTTQSLLNTYAAIGTQSDLNGANRKAYAAVVSNTLNSVIADGVVLSGSSEYEGVAIAAASTSYMMLANEINSANQRDIYFRKMSIGLVPEFDLKFGAVENDDRGAAVAELPNGDILILGTMQLAGQQDKIALIKLRPNGTF